MNNIKVNLSILLPGSTMLSVDESTRIVEEPVRTPGGRVKHQNGQPVTTQVKVMDVHKHNKFEIEVMNRGKKETIKVFTRKSKPAKQVIHLSEEAYEYMVDSETPYQYKGVWKGLKPNERLRWHCNRIAESLGGTVDDIQVLD